MPSPPRHFLHQAHESRQIQYRHLANMMQLKVSFEVFAIFARYALSPRAFVFIFSHLARCYPASITPPGPLAWPQWARRSFGPKIMNLVTELERLADALESEAGNPAQISLASIAERIAKNLSVRTDEVAILGVSNRWRHLHFVVPEAL